MAYGYRHDDPGVHLAKPGLQKEGSEVTMSDMAQSLYLGTRPTVAVSAGCHVEGVTLPHCDPKDMDTMVAGFQKRANARPPSAQEDFLSGLADYVQAQLASGRFGSPISPDEDVSFEGWIENTGYPDWRKQELREVNEKMVHILEDPRHLQNKSFMKDEHYTDWKHARGINSRSDQFKCFSGPLFKLIEKRVFSAPEFIKKVPCHDRPNYIMDRLFAPGARYFSSDYTSFESVFIKKLMMAVEIQCYRYFARQFPEFLKIVTKALTGTNVCKYKWFTARLEATRMSGDMCTSLGNGFSNLMFMEYVCMKLGSKCVGVVEGDDGLFRIEGVVPGPDDFAKLGLIIKCEEHESLTTASFCGIVFAEEDLINVTDPRKVLASTSWLTGRYSKAKKNVHLDLLRCKGLSAAHMYNGCPIITALARYVLRATRGRDLRNVTAMRHWSQYERDWLNEILAAQAGIEWIEPPTATRLLVEKLYGISWETQESIERYLDSLNDVQPLSLNMVDFPEAWCVYANRYCLTVSASRMDDPCVAWAETRPVGKILEGTTSGTVRQHR